MASLATANADAAESTSSSEAVDVKKWNGPTPKLNDYRDEDIMYSPQMLTEASEIEAFEEMKKKFEGQAVVSCEDTLLRCLMARDFNVDEAVDLLKKSITWREKTYPVRKSVFINDPLFKNGAFFAYGKDIRGRPVIVVRSRCFCPNERDLEAAKASAAYVFGHCLTKFPSNARFTIIYDREGFSLRKNWDKELIKEIIEVCQNNFPERLNRILVYPCGWVFNTLWAVVRLFMDDAVRQKVVLLSSKEEFTEYIDPSELLKEHGGTVAMDFDADAYGEELPDEVKNPSPWLRES